MELTLTELVLALLVAVFGTARLTRIISHDEYPPMVWLRAHWEARVGENWGKLLTCIWCAQPYVAAGCAAWGILGDFHDSWWWFWGILGLAQVGSMVLAYDEPPE